MALNFAAQGPRFICYCEPITMWFVNTVYAFKVQMMILLCVLMLTVSLVPLEYVILFWWV